MFAFHVQCDVSKCSLVANDDEMDYSLRRRRDLIAMASTVDSQQIAMHVELYSNLLKVLTNHVTAMEPDFFEVGGCSERYHALYRPALMLCLTRIGY